MAAAQQNQLIIKVDSDLMARIQRYAQRLIASQPPGIKLSRTDAIRVILHKGLEALEAEEEPR